jgi:hypothetical protein
VRSVGPWADITRIKTWLNECEHKHAACNVAGEQNGHLLLIDVVDNCLHQSSLADRYFALSYVWGMAQFTTLKSNFDRLLVPGAFLTESLSQSITDAMSLLRSMGERYIWVDAIVSCLYCRWRWLILS